MEMSIRIAWLLLALLHVMPALSVFLPALVESLYGFKPEGELAVLMTHRGVLFLAVFVAALIAAFHEPSRKLASVVIGISVIGFLIVYANAGFIDGNLRRIAIPDAIGLLPLVWVAYNAWR